MVRDEHEMLVEYSEMTAFNFNSKEFKNITKEFKECENVLMGLKWLINDFVKGFKKAVV